MSGFVASGAYLEVDGKPVPAQDLFWGVFARCGCLSGCTVVDRGSGDVLVTADQARADMCDDIKALIDRSIEDGKTYRLITSEKFKMLTMACDHSPKWGVVKVAAPEGYAWATTDRWPLGRRTYTRHIVSADLVAAWGKTGPALCGAMSKTTRPWSIDQDNLADTVTCRKCESAVTS